MRRLKMAPLAGTSELLHSIERRGLSGRGCSMVDISLLASARIVRAASLWTLDRSLQGMAENLGLAWEAAG